MRHRKVTIKLGRSAAHRDALLASQVCSLIHRGRIRTTVPKAKASRSLAEKMVTLGKRGTLAARRLALQRLHSVGAVHRLFESIAPAFKDRQGGYTRIVRTGLRGTDSADMALLEWTNYTPPAPRPKKEKGGKKAVTPDAAPPKEEAAKS